MTTTRSATALQERVARSSELGSRALAWGGPDEIAGTSPWGDEDEAILVASLLADLDAGVLGDGARVGVVDTARAIHDVLDRVVPAGPDSDGLADVGADRLREVVSDLDRAIIRLQTVRLRVVAAAGRARAGDRDGLADTGAWLSGVSRTGGSQARDDVRLAEALAGALPVTAEALGSGEVSTAHAGVIEWAMRRLPDRLSPGEREQVEGVLVDTARSATPDDLRRSARRAIEAAESATDRDADVAEEEALRSEEQRALDRTRLTMRDNRDGTVSGSFVLPALQGSMLRKVMQAMTSPRREGAATGAGATGWPSPGRSSCGAAATDVSADDVSAAGSLEEGIAAGEATGADAGAVACPGAAANAGTAADEALEGSQRGGRKDLAHLSAAGSALRAARAAAAGGDAAHRFGLAFAEVLEHLPTDHLHPKVAATIVVTIEQDRMVSGLGGAHLDTGQEISSGQARRLACNAGLVPAVLGGASVPLDLGRAARLFSESQRTALAAVYDVCAAVGCDRPFAWCEMHHREPWSSGGRTDLANAIPLCGFHHRLIEDPSYRHTVTTDTRGRHAVSYRQVPRWFDPPDPGGGAAGSPARRVAGREPPAQAGLDPPGGRGVSGELDPPGEVDGTRASDAPRPGRCPGPGPAHDSGPPEWALPVELC